MRKPELTPLFPGRVKPVRVGVYERKRLDKGFSYAYWNGIRWSVNCRTPAFALKFAHIHSSFQSRPWRGLAEEPK